MCVCVHSYVRTGTKPPDVGFYKLVVAMGKRIKEKYQRITSGGDEEEEKRIREKEAEI